MKAFRSAADGAALFNAIITPHRSLSPRGLRWLLGGITVLVAIVSFRFWLLGAWPVVAFSIAEVGFAGFLLWLNHRSARAVELVTLYEDHVRIIRTSAKGVRRELSLPSAWLTVEVEEVPHRVTKLWLCQRTRRVEIGAALGEEEKRDLAEAMKMALDAQRNPRFNNPQLQD